MAIRDLIQREIDLLGRVIQAIMEKIGVLKTEGYGYDLIFDTAKTELAEQLNLDLEALLDDGNIAGTLVERHGFTNGDLEKLAELLYSLTDGAEDSAHRLKMTAAIIAIYDYLASNSYMSFNSYYILKELEKYM